MKQKRLNLYMNGILVGYLEKSRQGAIQFGYAQSWLDMPGARPISLSLPLIQTPYTGDLVYNFFDNLLPDNAQIRSRIQSKFRLSSNHPFDLLAQIGRDCIGAIELIDGEIPTFKKTIECRPLSKSKIANILRGYEKNPLGMSDDLDDFRISLAGAQEKSAFLYYDKKWQQPLGHTPTTHIFKLPIGMIQHQGLDLRDSCENEWLCSQIAKAFGLQVPKCNIELFEDIKVLIVERFDRKLASDKSWIMRLPQEDLCQALGFSSNLKYQSDGGPGIRELMAILLGSEDAIHDRDRFFQAQILFWLLCAIDGHAKNFSIFIEPNGRFKLTPFYDIMSAYPLTATKQLAERKIKMAMALKGKITHYRWFEVKRQHFMDTAKTVGYPPERAEQLLDKMLEEVETVIEQVTKLLPKAFPEKVAGPIFDGMRFMRNRLSSKTQA